MTTGLTFVDTNILVYAEDPDDPYRRGIAAQALADLWRAESGTLSTQVMQEFYNAVTRKRMLPPSRARGIVAEYEAWPVVESTAQLIVSASLLHERHGFAFWDAMIVEAALLSGATTLLSEDLQHGRRLGGLEITNPFRPTDP